MLYGFVSLTRHLLMFFGWILVLAKTKEFVH